MQIQELILFRHCRPSLGFFPVPRALEKWFLWIVHEIVRGEMAIGKSSALIRSHLLIFVLLTLVILPRVIPDSVSAVCEFSLTDNNKLYSYSLASPIPKFPHGALSEDGYHINPYNLCISKCLDLFRLNLYYKASIDYYIHYVYLLAM